VTGPFENLAGIESFVAAGLRTLCGENGIFTGSLNGRFPVWRLTILIQTGGLEFLPNGIGVFRGEQLRQLLLDCIALRIQMLQR